MQQEWLRMELKSYKKVKNMILFTWKLSCFLDISQLIFSQTLRVQANFWSKIIIFQAWVSDYSYGLIYYMHGRVCKSCCLCLEVLNMVLCVFVKDLLSMGFKLKI